MNDAGIRQDAGEGPEMLQCVSYNWGVVKLLSKHMFVDGGKL